MRASGIHLARATTTTTTTTTSVSAPFAATRTQRRWFSLGDRTLGHHEGLPSSPSSPSPAISSFTATPYAQKRYVSIGEPSRDYRDATPTNAHHDSRMHAPRFETQSEPAQTQSHEDKPPLFDTFEASKELQTHGLDKRQSEAIMKLLDRTVKEVSARMGKEFITRTSYGGDLQRQWQELEQMRRNILIMEKTEIFTLRNELERAKSELQNQRLVLDRELAKVENGQKLDISFLKSHVTSELLKVSEKLELSTESEISRSEHHFAGEIKKQIAEVKLDAYKSVVALIFAVGTLAMTYIRFFPPKDAPSSQPPQVPVVLPMQQSPTILMENTSQTKKKSI